MYQQPSCAGSQQHAVNELIIDLATQFSPYRDPARKYISFSKGRATLTETNRYENVL